MIEKIQILNYNIFNKILLLIYENYFPLKNVFLHFTRKGGKKAIHSFSLKSETNFFIKFKTNCRIQLSLFRIFFVSLTKDPENNTKISNH